jgi:hypothetical protein
MGFSIDDINPFDSEFETAVGISTSKVYEEVDEGKKNRETIVKTILSNGSLVENLKIVNLDRLSEKADLFFKYGKEEYPNGLPTNNAFGVELDTEQLQVAIETELGESISIIGAQYWPLYVDFFTEYYLRKYLGFNNNSGTWYITGLHQYAVFVSSRFLGTAGLEITYTFSTTPNSLPVTTAKVFPLTGIFSPAEKHYQVIYSTIANPEIVSYWLYYPPSPSVPNPLVPLISSIDSGSDFFPVVPIRENTINVVDGKLVTEWEGQGQPYMDNSFKEFTDTLVGKLGLDLYDLTRGINQVGLTQEEAAEDPDLEGPDLKDVDDAFLVVALNIYEEGLEAIEYLFEWFKLQAIHSPTGQEYADAIANGQYRYQSIEFTDGEYNTAIQYKFIDVNTYPGQMSKSFERALWYSEFLKISRLTLLKDLGNGNYESVVVDGLFHSTSILSSEPLVRIHLEMGDVLSDDFDREDDKFQGFYIPLDYTLLKTLPVSKQEILLLDSIRTLIYAVKTVKKKWYQKDLFKAFILAITVVAAYYTGQNWIAAAGTSLTALLIAISITFAQAYAAKVIMKKVADELGVDVAAILAIIVTVISMKKAGTATTKAIPTDLPWATDFLAALQISLPKGFSASIPGAVQSYIQDELTKITTEITLVEEQYKTGMEEIESAADIYAGESLLDPFDLLAATEIATPVIESPSALYTRTTHLTNIGVLSLDMISTYVERKKELPTFNDTLNMNLV